MRDEFDGNEGRSGGWKRQSNMQEMFAIEL